MTNPTCRICAEFPFKSHYLDVLDSNLHYLDEGKGDPILFIHGSPTSSYIWRNIIPALEHHGRCIAPDLIGMGKSGKPDIAYRVFDQIRYIEAFIDKLGLKNITLVLHGLGSIVGFDYAMRHPENIKGLAFAEAYIQVAENWSNVSLPLQEFFTVLKGADDGYNAIVNQNFLLEKLLPAAVLRKLTKEELAHYAEPFPTPETRKPLWQQACDLPLPNGRQDVKELVTHYSEQLKASSVPKLLMYSIPGFVTTIDNLLWAQQYLSNLTLADLGEALHCPQETNPKAMCDALVGWYKNI